MRSRAVVPQFIASRGNSLLHNTLAIFGGVTLLALLAQVSIRLPFTPVPITGQTFGVALVALLWGATRGTSIMTLYILASAAGLPILSLGRPLTWGPTMGYLAGMLVASFVIGRLADRGWSRSFGKALLATYCGSFFVFCFGLLILNFFVPSEALFYTGFLPFLPGDLVKNILAATIATSFNKRL